MKLTIERSALLASLAHVQNVVERRNTIPILSNVKIEAKDGVCRFTATDMDLAIVATVAAEIGQEGTITAPAHTLYDVVRKLPEGAQVELSHDGEQGKLNLRAGRSRFTFACLPPEDFPVMAEGDLPNQFTLAARELRRLIDKTRFAISTEETRFYLNGIYLHAQDGDNPTLRAIATDGHRLAKAEVALPSGAAGMPGVIVPRKLVAELRKLIEDSEGEVEIALSDTKIRVAVDTAIVTSKLIDGTFPDYERVIPSGNDKTLRVDCRSFADAVDRVSTISTEKSRSVKLSLDGDTMTLSASSPDAGSGLEEVAIEYGSEALEIGFNARYVLDMAAQIEGENIEFLIADASSPTIIHDSGDAGVLYVLMPMRV